ncbi:MAG: hypothetical protein ACRDQB_04625 [Thermocrispum sp.]
MTTTDAFRRAARVTAAAAPLTVLLAAAPALADTPSAWEEAEPMSVLTALLIFVGAPLALFVVISLLVVGPSMVRGDRNRRGVASWTEPAWFGNEMSRSEQSRGELEGGDSQPGGASARW